MGFSSIVLKILLVSFIGILLLCLKYLGIHSPLYLLSNNLIIEGYQATHLPQKNSDIVIVNISDFSVDAIKDQIEILSLYNPAVIGVDYFPENNPKNEQRIEFEKIVLPIRIYEDSSTFAPNVFTHSVCYGYVNIDSYSTFSSCKNRNEEVYYSFPAQIVSLYDSNFLIRRNRCVDGRDIINYAGNVYDFTYLGDLSNATPKLLEKVKGKIVLVGYLGVDNPIPNSEDEIDSHRTPRSMMYGVVFWANIIHTLLGDQINQQNFLWSVLMAIGILVFNTKIIGMLLKTRMAYVKLKVIQVVQLAAFFALSSFVIHRFHMLLDYEIAAMTIVIISEVIFWVLKSHVKNASQG